MNAFLEQKKSLVAVCCDLYLGKHKGCKSQRLSSLVNLKTLDISGPGTKANSTGSPCYQIQIIDLPHKLECLRVRPVDRDDSLYTELLWESVVNLGARKGLLPNFRKLAFEYELFDWELQGRINNLKPDFTGTLKLHEISVTRKISRAKWHQFPFGCCCCELRMRDIESIDS